MLDFLSKNYSAVLSTLALTISASNFYFSRKTYKQQTKRSLKSDHFKGNVSPILNDGCVQLDKLRRILQDNIGLGSLGDLDQQYRNGFAKDCFSNFYILMDGLQVASKSEHTTFTDWEEIAYQEEDNFLDQVENFKNDPENAKELVRIIRRLTDGVRKKIDKQVESFIKD